MQTIKAHAKVNVFLKITGHKDGYHTLISRFIRIENLYDTISIKAQKCQSFTIDGCDGIPNSSNTIYKAYLALQKETKSTHLEEFFRKHKVVVTKRIPSQAGLGGGSSDGAAFMRLVNDICNLNISIEKLSSIGSTIGADFPFFIYNYSSANVGGFGEIVEEFKEEPLTIETFTPPIECDTTVVYKTFKNNFLSIIELDSFDRWEKIGSRELLREIKEPIILNDLYLSALKAYPKLEGYAKDGWYFSGSGSSFFRVIGV